MEKIESTESCENPLNKEFSAVSCSENVCKEDQLPEEKTSIFVTVSNATAVEQEIETENEATVISSTNSIKEPGEIEAEKTEVNGSPIKTIEKNDESSEHVATPKPLEKNLNEAVVLINKALCANYRSDSGSDSTDSESDSSTTTTDSSSEDEYDSVNVVHSKRGKEAGGNRSHMDYLSSDLPPIEDLKISLPEDACVEIGVVTSIIDTLVIVESYKGTAALDVDTVLFLESGKRPLGKIFEILGPVSEPVYAVRFNTEDQIASNEIVKGMKVYYAPQTHHTTFVFLSEVLKCRGSDASWKDNIEAPSEFQDFSDDEEENKFRKKCGSQSETINSDERQNSRKRTFSGQRSDKMEQSNRFNAGRKNMTGKPRFVPGDRYRGGNPSNRFNGVPSRPVPSGFAYPPPLPFLYGPSPNVPQPPPRISGFPFPGFGNLQFSNYYHGLRPPFFTQQTHSYPQANGTPWNVIFPPPPPPPQKEEEVPQGKNSK